MKHFKKIFLIILYTINAIILTGLIMSSFSGYVSPHRFVIFSYLGLIFPFIFVASLAFFFTWLLFKQWKQSFIHLMVFAICGGAIYTYCPIHKKSGEIPEGAIKLLTYNVMRFNETKKDNPTGDVPNTILKFIQESDADIVCIQEYGASKRNSNLLKEEDIMDALYKYPYFYFHSLNFPFSSDIYGLAIFSRFPILSTQKVDFESTYNGAFIAELDIYGKRVTLINNHLESNKLSENDRTHYYQFTKEMGAQSFDAFTQAMVKRLSPAFKTRASQAQIISQDIKENSNPYIIVCGDFNDTPISYTRHKIKGNLRDAFVDSGFGLGITYNKFRFLFRIDYILHSNNIKSYNCTVGDLKSSDHYPLWCFLEFRE